MYENILVPLDGSNFAEIALPHAVAFAAKFGSKITLVSVFETPHIYQSVERDDGVLNDIHQAAIRGVSEYLERIKVDLIAQGLIVETTFIESANVPGALLQAIDDGGADLIVMSTHGRTGIDQWRFGSVAQRVARHTTVPVVLIRPKKKASQED